VGNRVMVRNSRNRVSESYCQGEGAEFAGTVGRVRKGDGKVDERVMPGSEASMEKRAKDTPDRASAVAGTVHENKGIVC
jgi:hypothetical protein